MFLANNFALSDGEDNNSRPLNRGGTADLPLLRTLSAIRQKSWKPSFWEVIDSFVLVAYASLAASRTLLQQLLACLNLSLDSEDLFGWYKWKVISMNYGNGRSCWKPWRWVKFDFILMMRDIYSNSNLNPLTNFTSSRRSTEFKDILPWNIFQMITKTIPINTRTKTGHETRHPALSLLEIQWKLRQHDQNFPMEGKLL